jgi:hypothetical protein
MVLLYELSGVFLASYFGWLTGHRDVVQELYHSMLVSDIFVGFMLVIIAFKSSSAQHLVICFASTSNIELTFLIIVFQTWSSSWSFSR